MSNLKNKPFKFPSKIACQARNPFNLKKTNHILIAKELSPIRYN